MKTYLDSVIETKDWCGLVIPHPKQKVWSLVEGISLNKWENITDPGSIE